MIDVQPPAGSDQIDQSVRVTVLPSGLVSRADFARYIGRDVKTVTQWAWKKTGPRPVKIGGRAYYRFDDVRRFANGETVERAEAS